jgi:replication-associated recombination protein RarA
MSSFKDILEKSKDTVQPQTTEKPKAAEKKSTGGEFITKGGYDAFEVMSCLQKDIRRGREAQAMYWAFEMESLNPSWLWKRLMIITTEDVGPADPSMITLVKTLWETYEKMKEMAKGKTPESHILGMAVLSLCRANKSHEAMYLPMTVNWWKKYLNWKLEVPDYALDIHTRRGKKLGRGRNHWYSEGFRLFKKATVEGDKWGNAFRIGDELKYDLKNADDYYFHDHNGEYQHTEEDAVIDPETGLPTVGTYDKDKV